MSERINRELKQKIIEKIRSEGLSVSQASDEFGLSKNTIYSWIGSRAKGEPSIIELAKLKKENNELKQIIGGLALDMKRGGKNRTRQVND